MAHCICVEMQFGGGAAALFPAARKLHGLRGVERTAVPSYLDDCSGLCWAGLCMKQWKYGLRPLPSPQSAF